MEIVCLRVYLIVCIMCLSTVVCVMEEMEGEDDDVQAGSRR